MNHNLVFPRRLRYGAVELKRNYRRHLSRAFGCSVTLHALIIGLYWSFIVTEPEVPPGKTVRIFKYEELPVPSISNTSFGLSSYPVLAQTETYVGRGNRKPITIPKGKQLEHPVAPSRSTGGDIGDLPAALDQRKVDASEEIDASREMKDRTTAVGGGSGLQESDFSGGRLLAAREGVVPNGPATSGIGSYQKFSSLAQGRGAEPFGVDDGEEGGVGYALRWGQGGVRKKTSGDLPRYPDGVNVEAEIKILAVVLPDGNVKSVQPAQKGNTILENAAMNELRFWKFQPLRPPAPQIEQTCVVTFHFRLK